MSGPAAPRTAGWLAAAAGGRLAGDPAAPLPGTVTTDTRTLRPGDLFVALPGRSTDGARFVAEAAACGAFGVAGRPGDVAGAAVPVAIAVPDPLEGLRGIARAWRAALACPAVAITGSVGKTTTKDLLAGLLAPVRRTHATVDSFNTFMGVPATLAAAPPDTEVLVVEIAMRARGDIAGKAAVVAPTAGAITAIAPAHLDTSGTLADVARHKAELIAALPPGAPCVVPAGEPLLAPYLRDDLDTVAHGPGGDVFLEAFDGTTARVVLRGTTTEVQPGFAEPHNLDDLVTAMAVAEALGVVPAGPLDLPRSPYRWERHRLRSGADLIADCFNVVPRSLERGLEAFVAEPAARRVAVLGPMEHLGAASAEFHRAAGAHACALGVDVLVTVSEPARAYGAGFRGDHRHVADAAAARALAEALTEPGDRVFLKGPWSMGLWEFLDA